MGSFINPRAIEARAKSEIYPYNSSLYMHLVVEVPTMNDLYMSDLYYPYGGNYSYQGLSQIQNSSSNTVSSDGRGGIVHSHNIVVYSGLTIEDGQAYHNGSIVSTDPGTSIKGGIITPTSSTNSSWQYWWAFIEYHVGGVPSPFTPNGTNFLMDILTNGWWHDMNPEGQP